jgi:hypothetical protein
MRERNAGSGYLTACMALMVRPGGHVLGVEAVPELAVASVGHVAEAVPELRDDTTCWAVRAGNVLEGAVATACIPCPGWFINQPIKQSRDMQSDGHWLESHRLQSQRTHCTLLSVIAYHTCRWPVPALF